MEPELMNVGEFIVDWKNYNSEIDDDLEIVGLGEEGVVRRRINFTDESSTKLLA